MTQHRITAHRVSDRGRPVPPTIKVTRDPDEAASYVERYCADPRCVRVEHHTKENGEWQLLEDIQ